MGLGTDQSTLTRISLSNDKAAFFKFARVHRLDNLSNLTGVQIFEEVILHDGIFDQLFGSVE